VSEKILEVSDATFEREVLQAESPVVIDFWAPWCGPCRAMEPVFDELAEQHTNVKFTKLNVDDNMQTSARYQVLSIPTLLVIDKGEVVKTLIGAMPKARLSAELAPWLGGVAAA